MERAGRPARSSDAPQTPNHTNVSQTDRPSTGTSLARTNPSLQLSEYSSNMPDDLDRPAKRRAVEFTSTRAGLDHSLRVPARGFTRPSIGIARGPIRAVPVGSYNPTLPGSAFRVPARGYNVMLSGPRSTQTGYGTTESGRAQPYQPSWDDINNATPTSFPSQMNTFQGTGPFSAYTAALLRSEDFVAFTAPHPGYDPNSSRYPGPYTAPEPNDSALPDFDTPSTQQTAPAPGDFSHMGANLATPEISDLHSRIPTNDESGTPANESALTTASTQDLLNQLRDRFHPTSDAYMNILAALQQVESQIPSDLIVNNVRVDFIPTQLDLDRTKPLISRKDGKDIYGCQWPKCGKEKTSANFTKHMRRHIKPFCCTYVRECSKQFGSKNDWSRHESSQHSFEEGWRCPKKDKQTGVPCASFFEKRDMFWQHLMNEHGVKDVQKNKKLNRECHISNKYEGRFWCGFCKGIRNMGRGLDGDKERANHICDHFIRRKQTIADWTPPQGNLTKAQIDEKTRQGKAGVDEDALSDTEVDDNDNDSGDSPEDGDDGHEEDEDIAPTLTDVSSDKSDSKEPSSHSPTPTPAPPTSLSRKRTFASIDSGDTQASAPASPATRQSERVKQRTRRHEPAKYVVCCGCWDNSPFGAREQLLELHKNCQYCGHKFCRICENKPAHEGGDRLEE